MAEFNLIVFDRDKKLGSVGALESMPNFALTCVEDDRKLTDINLEDIINIVVFPVSGPEDDLPRLSLVLKSLEQFKAIVLVFIPEGDCPMQLVEYLNEDIIDKVVFREFEEKNIVEEAINASIILSGKFQVSDSISDEARMLDQVNEELELKNKWLAHEKEVGIIFGDTSLDLDDKLYKTFSKITEFFDIEHFDYYETRETDNGLSIDYRFSSVANVSAHCINDTDEYSPVYVYYNKEKLFIDDYSLENRVQKNPNIDIEIISQLSLPVFSGGKILGVVEFYNKKDAIDGQIPEHLRLFLEKMISDLQYHIEINLLKDEIQLSRNEMTDIFMNIEEGILTFSSDLTVNPEYSSAVCRIFSKENVEDVNITEILFENVLPRKDLPVEVMKDNFDAWARSVFEMPDQWDMLKGLATLHFEKSGPQFLEAEYLPIIKNGAVEKVMAIITDVTAQRQAEEELKKQEDEHNQKISMLMEIISMKPNIFHDFLKESFDRVTAIKDLISNYDFDGDDAFNTDFLNNLFSNVHAIKGSAGFVGLGNCNKKFHLLENSINRIKAGNDYSGIPELIMEVEKEISYFSDIINNLLELITEFAKYSLVESDENMEFHSKIVEFAGRHRDYFDTAGDELFNDISGRAQKAISDYKNNLIEGVHNKCAEAVSRQARRMGKDIELEYDVDSRLPVFVLKKLEAMLIPLVINSIDHGIEPPEDRLKKHKNPRGRIGIKGLVETGSSHVGILVYDNGAGISHDRIKAAAAKKGIYTEEEMSSMGEDDIIDIIFKPAFSTKEQATTTSGRGYGMDIVKKITDSIGADIKVFTKPGLWTMFRISLQTQGRYI
ncbi:MAG: Hpt domain-containing protein [Oligoflexia bacterium]|nr:Hpt domain-containing protein [Oligoflexia bacterium]